MGLFTRGRQTVPALWDAVNTSNAQSAAKSAAKLPTRSPPSSPSCVTAGTQAAYRSMGDAAPSTADLMAAITSLKETLASKIDTVTTKVSLIRHDMDKF